MKLYCDITFTGELLDDRWFEILGNECSFSCSDVQGVPLNADPLHIMCINNLSYLVQITIH